MKFFYFLFALCCCMPLKTSAQQAASVKASDNVQTLNPIIGNWYDPTTNVWQYGFFEHFAIIGGKQYSYKSVRSTGQSISVSLQQLSKPLEIKLIDSTLYVNGKAFQKVKKTLPAYKKADPTQFSKLQFRKTDTVTIQGYLRNNKSDQEFSIRVTYLYTNDDASYFTKLDSLGRFEVKVPLQNPTEANIDLWRSNLSNVLVPGEKIYLFYDLSSKETIFYGDNAQFHNEIAAYNKFVGANGTSMEAIETQAHNRKTLKDTNYLNYKLAELDSLTAIDKQFTSHNPFLSQRASYYIGKINKVNIGMELMQKRFMLDVKQGERFSATYMNTVRNSFMNHLPDPLTLFSAGHTLLRDYMEYSIVDKSNERENIFTSEALCNIIKKGRIKVSDDLKEYAILYQQRDTIISSEIFLNKPDSLKFQEPILLALNALTAKDSTLHRRYQDLFRIYRKELSRNTDLELFVLKSYKTYLDVGAREWAPLYFTRSMFTFFRNNPSGFTDDELNALTANLNNDVYKELLFHENSRLKVITKRHLQYADNLKGTELEELDDADKLLVSILSPHQGKVVYLDFWGIWCGPCVHEMKYAPGIKKDLEEKDVVFIYFANNTPEDALKTFVKEKNLEGKNVFHYNLPTAQQQLLERKLEVRAFPTYMLVDKKGALVNTNAPRPSQKAELIAEIDDLNKP